MTAYCALYRYTRPLALSALTSLLWLVPVFGIAQTDALEVARFSQAAPGAALPDAWTALTFRKIPRHTVYRLVEDGGVSVIRADSDNAASGLVRHIRIDPAEYPRLRWRWKVANVLQRGDVHSRAGDDYPARLYITFEYDADKLGVFERLKFDAVRLIYGEYPPLAAINYLWTSKEPPGTLVPNAYSGHVRMLVLRNNKDPLNHWVEEERNVYQDYVAAFGEPPGMISGVAVMTDTDNTGERAAAWYGDITFLKGP